MLAKRVLAVMVCIRIVVRHAAESKKQEVSEGDERRGLTHLLREDLTQPRTKVLYSPILVTLLHQ